MCTVQVNFLFPHAKDNAIFSRFSIVSFFFLFLFCLIIIIEFYHYFLIIHHTSRASGCSLDAIIFMLSNPDFVDWCKNMVKRLYVKVQKRIITREPFNSIEMQTTRINKNIIYLNFVYLAYVLIFFYY